MIGSLFPGQGSLTAGAGAPWVDDPAWAIVGEISGIVEVDVAALLVGADEAELQATHNAQLAGLALGLVVHEAVTREGVVFGASAGHSLGEYTSLAASGVLTRASVAALVNVRGASMAGACAEEQGTMAAVMGLTTGVAEEVCAALRKDGGRVWVANRNSSMQVAVAGASADVATAIEECRTQGARKVVELGVEGAFHTELMAPAQAALDAQLNDTIWHGSALLLASNVEGRVVEDPTQWADLLARQLCSPVRWDTCVTSLVHAGTKAFVELGAGTTLSGLVKRIQRGVKAISVQTPDDIAAAKELFDRVG